MEERTGTSTTADRQYVWHPYYIDALAISYNSSGTAHYYVQDGNFNVTAAMDSSGAVVERYSTTPYGECIVLNTDFTLDSSSGGDGLSDISNEFTYTGRRLDVETGLYQYRHRYYHAQLGRFVNRDPIGYEGSKWNLCEYANSRPLVRVDPNGTTTMLSDEECCAVGRQYRRGAKGGVICCEGRLVPCNWAKYPTFTIEGPDLEMAFEPQAWAIEQDCILEHETFHLSQMKNFDCNKECDRVWRPDIEDTGTSLDELYREECEAYHLTIRCLKSRISECTSDLCQKSIRHKIDFDVSVMKKKYKCAKYAYDYDEESL